jgi:hypothetical protein
MDILTLASPVIVGALAAGVALRVASLRYTRLKVALELHRKLPQDFQGEWEAMIRHQAETITSHYFFPRFMTGLISVVVLLELGTIAYLLPTVPYQLGVAVLLITLLAAAAYLRSRVRVMRYMKWKAEDSPER